MLIKKSLLIINCLVNLLGYGQTKVIGFYNLENFFDTLDDKTIIDEEYLPNSQKMYNTSYFKQKLNNLNFVLNNLGTSIDSSGASIIGLVELENESVLKNLQNSLKEKGKNYEYVHYNSSDNRGIDVAILYNPSTFIPYESKLISINDSSNKYKIKREILYIKGFFSGELIHLLVSHWPSRRGGQKRSESGRILIADKLKSISTHILQENKFSNIIIMGDFNDNPNDYSLIKVLATKTDIKKVNLQDIYNPFYKIFKNGQGTLAHNDVWSLFDQILVSGNFLNLVKKGWHFKKAKIYKNPLLIETAGKYKGYPKRTWNGNFFQNGFSDHLPTFIVLEWY